MSVELVQGTDEWKKARLGKVTASRIADVMARTKSGYSASRANYMAELIAQRLTDTVTEGYTNAAMQWGIDHEDEARKAFELVSGSFVEQVGFIDHPRIIGSGASPDGLVGDDETLEIKCPGTATHLDTLLGAEIDGKYLYQMQWQMACAGRKRCHFVSFDPRLPERMRLHVRVVNRDDATISMMEKEVQTFLAELNVKLAELRAKYPEAA